MSRVTDNHAPSLRLALRDSAAAALDRPLTPASAIAGPNAGDDAELIRLCDRMVEIQSRTFEIYCWAGTPWDPDNHPVIGLELAALSAAWLEVMPRLMGLAPVTLPDAQALARAVLAPAGAAFQLVGRNLRWGTRFPLRGAGCEGRRNAAMKLETVAMAVVVAITGGFVWVLTYGLFLVAG